MGIEEVNLALYKINATVSHIHHQTLTRIVMSDHVTPTLDAGAPPYQTAAHASYGPGDSYLNWKKMKNYMDKKNRELANVEDAQEDISIEIFHAIVKETEYTQGCEQKDKLPAIDSSWLNKEI